MNRSKLHELALGRSFLSAIALAITAMFVMTGPISAQGASQVTTETKPTIVLVHGAFADSASWGGVIPLLLAQGYPVVAAANPLRGIKIDADVGSPGTELEFAL